MSANANPAWLADSRRFLYNEGGKMYLTDSVSGRTREILSVAPYQVGRGISISADDRTIYFTSGLMQRDIWLMKQP